MDIETTCSKCGAALKLRAAVVGRTIQCPRCGAKTEVARRAKPALSATAASPDQTSALPPVEADVVDEPAESPAPSAPPQPDADAEQLRGLQDQVRRMEADLEVARLRTEESDRARQQALDSRSLDLQAAQQEAVQHQATELQTAKQCIAELQARLAAEYQKRISSSAGRSAAEIEREVLQAGGGAMPVVEDEVADPDALIADIKRSSFGRDLRSSVLIHAVLIAITSVGLLIAWVRGAPPPTSEPDKSGQPAATNAVPASRGAASDSTNPAAARPAVAPAARSASAEGSGTSSLEQAVQSLPSKSELPKESSVSLDGDL